MFVLAVGVRIFKAVKFGVDVDLFNELRSHQQIHHHSTRYNENLITPQCHKSKSQCSLAYSGPKIRNDLPLEFKYSVSLANFKKLLTSHLVSSHSYSAT